MVLKAAFIEEISAMLAVTLNTINRKIPVLLSITENMNNLCDPAFQVLVVQVVNSFLFEKRDQLNNHQLQIFTKEKSIFLMINPCIINEIVTVLPMLLLDLDQHL